MKKNLFLYFLEINTASQTIKNVHKMFPLISNSVAIYRYIYLNLIIYL